MPSPFPGMDPFLEEPKTWASFHHHMIAALYQLLLPGLVDKYRARIGTRQYVSETPLFTSMIREHHTEEFIEIRSRTDNRLVTLVEIVSLGNKLTTTGRSEYLNTRMQALHSRASVAEIDLLTQGKLTIENSRDTLVDADYVTLVARGMSPDRYEPYGTSIQKRLPKFKLPLAADDRDTVVDLQIAFARAFDVGDFNKQLDYKGPLPVDVKLSAENRKWVQEWLQQLNIR